MAQGQLIASPPKPDWVDDLMDQPHDFLSQQQYDDQPVKLSPSQPQVTGPSLP